MPDEALVHVIDDDDAARQSLAFLLTTAQVEVRTYDSAKGFLDVLPAVRSGCVITDVRMPEMTGIELLQHIRKLGLGLPVIVITGHGDTPVAIEAMRRGAFDFLEKPFDDEVLLNAVQAALGRQAEDDWQEAERRDLADRIAMLSRRELEVLRGLVGGHPNQVIAHGLGITSRTVEIYRVNVMTKMRASRLTDLVRMALIAGLLAEER